MIVGCLYLPNGNPAPGPKFDYKLRWFERLSEHAGHLLASGAPTVLAGDYYIASGKRTMNPSRFGIRTLGSVWAFIVSSSPISLFSAKM